MELTTEQKTIKVLESEITNLNSLIDEHSKVIFEIRCALPDGKKLRLNEIAQKVGQLAVMAKDKSDE